MPSTYRVYHATNFPPPFPFTPPPWPDGYRLVAEVQGSSLETAFARTNSIERHWSQQPGVTCYDLHARSTSVGDVVVNPEGRAFRCEGIGWRGL